MAYAMAMATSFITQVWAASPKSITPSMSWRSGVRMMLASLKSPCSTIQEEGEEEKRRAHSQGRCEDDAWE